MNRETIEKAADLYAAKAPASYTNGDYGKYAIADAFEEGAHWRINAAWHDPQQELPEKEGEWLLLESVVGRNTIYFPVKWANDGVGVVNHIKRWAYINDLIPERKEASL